METSKSLINSSKIAARVNRENLKNASEKYAITFEGKFTL